MKRRAFLKESALATAGFAFSPWILSDFEKISFLEDKPKELEIVTLTGTPQNRGHIHGETLRKKIHDIVNDWKELLGKNYKTDPDKYIDEFVEETNFNKAIDKWAPHLLEEVKGLAEGSGIDFKTMYAFQLCDEEWWYSRNKRFSISLPIDHHCSALAVFNQKGMPALQAQNMDLPMYTDGFQTLLQIKHENSSLESFIFTFAGYIYTTGMNNRGVSICCNTLLQLNPSTNGLPVAYIGRILLEQKNQADAVKFIHSIKHVSGQNYTIGGPKEVGSYESSANKISRFVPYKEATRVYHTNHPIVNDDQSVWKEILSKIPENKKPTGPNNSEIRLNSLEKRLKDPSKRVTVDTIKEILSSHDDPKNPVCNDRKLGVGGLTAGCVIMELSPESPVLHLAPGPPCSTEFKVFKF